MKSNVVNGLYLRRDITYSIDNSAPAYMNCHSLLVNGKDSDISLKDVLEVGKRNDIRNARELIG